MPEDFTASAMRHYSDGDLLREEKRFSNADQLYGFAAECAIKTALLGLPGCTEDGALTEHYRKHIDVLWDRALVQGIQRRWGPLAGLLKSLSSPFGDWSTNQRYDPDGTITETAVTRHRDVARRLLGSIGALGRRT